MRAKIHFSGCLGAELFSKELEESFTGVLEKNYTSDPKKGPVGFITASIDGRYWWDTMWSRDQGTFLRELVHYGEFEKAKQVWRTALKHLALNEDGYYSFPMFVYMNKPLSGKEMDGTALFVISSVLLWERLQQEDPFRQDIEKFLVGDTSPVRYVLMLLEKQPFLEGCGEFGGGLHAAEEPYYNVVQNSQMAFMLDMVGRRFGNGIEQMDVWQIKQRCIHSAKELSTRIREQMVFEDGSWIWCLDPRTGKQADDAILYDEGNKGFAGINGVLSHSSDILGVLPLKGEEWFLFPSLNTFWKLLGTPKRMEQFVKYGMYSQFERDFEGFLTSPSYGQGYALQCMLLLDLPELYTKAVHYLVDATLEPVYEVTRDSKYWFYERYLSPDSRGVCQVDEGCGALNLVNVTEPLKCARLMMGVDDGEADVLQIVPRLPIGWTEAAAHLLPVRTNNGHTRLELKVTADSSGRILSVYGKSEQLLPTLHIRVGTATSPQWVVIARGQVQFEAILK